MRQIIKFTPPRVIYGKALWILWIITLMSAGSMKAQSNSTYWYVDGLPNVWFYQPDVFAFRCVNGSAFTGSIDSTVVDSLVYHSDRADEAVEVYFKPTATQMDILNEIQNLWNSGQIEMPYISLTHNNPTTYTDDDWYVFDDRLIVNFVNPYPTIQEINDFMDRYNLTEVSFPDTGLPVLSAGPSYAYIFQIHLPASLTTQTGISGDYLIETARSAFINEGGFVANAEPNIVNWRGKKIPGSSIPVVTGTTNICFLNDYYEFHEWHIDNQYYQPTTQMNLGTWDADPDICECWAEMDASGQNLYGNGVKVGIMGYGDFWMPAPEMSNSFSTTYSWDCTMPPCVPLVSTFPGVSASRGSMYMSYIIGADHNNLYTAGIAPKSEVIPYKIANSHASTTSIVKAIEKALLNQVDVLVMDIFMPFQDVAIKDALWKHMDLGRKPLNLSVGYGTVIVSPSGFDANGNPGTTQPQYPAAYDYDVNGQTPEVIGVIANNRFDELCVPEYYGGGIAYSLASHYGSGYDVAAPGPIIVADNHNFYESPFGANIHRGAATTVAGIAALMLQKNKNLTHSQVRNLLRSGAEHVGGYTYTNGLSTELAYGRVNCVNSLPLYTTEIKDELEKASIILKQDENKIILSYPTFASSLAVWDMQGRKLFTAALPEKGEYETSLMPYAEGIYLLGVYDRNHTLIYAQKILKY